MLRPMKTHWGCAAVAALLVLAGSGAPVQAQDAQDAQDSSPAQTPAKQDGADTTSSDDDSASAPGGDTAPAAAATPPAKPTKADFEKAKGHYITATRALGNGEYIFAAKEFFAAYEITKDPILFFKIGLSHDMAGDCGAASIFYRRYLEEANPTGDEKADAQKRLADCDAKLGPVSSGPDPSSLPSTSAEPLPGPADLPDDPEAEATEPQVEEDSDLYRPSVGKATTMQTVAWVAIGAAAISGTIGGVLTMSADSKEAELEDLVAFPAGGMRTPFEGADREKYEKLVDDGERLQTMAYIAWGVAGAAATTAIVLFILDSGDSGSDEPSGQSAMVVPTAGPNGTVGVSASWEF